MLTHSFIYGMHHQECAVPNVDISLQSSEWTILSYVNYFI